MTIQVWIAKEIWNKHKDKFINILSNPTFGDGKVFFNDVSSHHLASAKNTIDELNDTSQTTGSGETIFLDYQEDQSAKISYPKGSPI